jgi:hypothetical protein
VRAAAIIALARLGAALVPTGTPWARARATAAALEAFERRVLPLLVRGARGARPGLEGLLLRVALRPELPRSARRIYELLAERD